MIYQQVLSFSLLAVYFLSLCFLGAYILDRWFKPIPVLFFVTSCFLVGVGIGVPVTYGLSCLLTSTGEPILWGVVAIVLVSCGVVGYGLKYKKRDEQKKIGQKSINSKHNKRFLFFDYCLLSDVALVLFAFIFSTWLMTKTFHGGVDGQMFTGSNNVFDFGHSLGLARSMSWGDNIPLASPFFSGLPFFYHFFFQFWVALLEQFGIGLVLAVNIPSILSFAALLVIVYFLPRMVWKQGAFVGWLAVLLTITHSTFTFWYLVIRDGLSFQLAKTIWQLPTYPYAGPVDGSIISVFMTLNNYVNQRHLAFSLALGLLLYICFIRTSRNAKKIFFSDTVVIVIGAGLLWYWNMAVSLGLMFLMTMDALVQRKIRVGLVSLVAYGCVIFLLMLPYVQVFGAGLRFFQDATKNQSAVLFGNPWNPVSYLWNNLGMLPVVTLMGFFALRREWKHTVPFLLFFITVSVMALYHHRGFDQKFLSFAIIGINMLAAVGLGWLWEKGWIARIVTLLLVGILTISGFVDLMAVKNEFAFPFISKDTAPVISWIHKRTPKHAIFISYADMIDPVVLAGRKNYFGFFGNVGLVDRSPVVRRIYQGETALARSLDISYILVPKWEKSDFPYTVNTDGIASNAQLVYEDERYMIFKIKDER